MKHSLTDFPKVVKIRRMFQSLAISDVAEAVREKIISSGLLGQVRPGADVAVTAGSRGIDRIAQVLRAVGEVVKSRGGKPFIVPAMGSHGGAAAAGQVKALRDMGVTEESVGMPIKSSMETVKIGEVSGGAPVFIDKIAFESDGIIAVNRIKPHTSFSGKYGSGLCKMLVVGLGKEVGATAFHKMGPLELSHRVPEMAELIIRKAPILGGVALVEDYHDKIAVIEAVTADKILAKDSELLEEANRLLPRLPFDDLDVLVVGEMGKNISGTGMDANVIGRYGIRLIPDPPAPRIKRIVVLGLTKESDGNANGIGMADIVTERLVKSIDWEATRKNVMASSFPEKAMLPISFPTDEEAIAAALNTSWIRDAGAARLAIIQNTLQLGRLLASESLIDEIGRQTDIEIMSDPFELMFDENGNLDSGWMTRGSVS